MMKHGLLVALALVVLAAAGCQGQTTPAPLVATAISSPTAVSQASPTATSPAPSPPPAQPTPTASPAPTAAPTPTRLPTRPTPTPDPPTAAAQALGAALESGDEAALRKLILPSGFVFAGYRSQGQVLEGLDNILPLATAFLLSGGQVAVDGQRRPLAMPGLINFGQPGDRIAVARVDAAGAPPVWHQLYLRPDAAGNWRWAGWLANVHVFGSPNASSVLANPDAWLGREVVLSGHARPASVRSDAAPGSAQAWVLDDSGNPLWVVFSTAVTTDTLGFDLAQAQESGSLVQVDGSLQRSKNGQLYLQADAVQLLAEDGYQIVTGSLEAVDAGQRRLTVQPAEGAAVTLALLESAWLADSANQALDWESLAPGQSIWALGRLAEDGLLAEQVIVDSARTSP